MSATLTPPKPEIRAGDLMDLLAATDELVDLADRPELHRRLEVARTRLVERRTRITILGPPGHGKTALAAALRRAGGLAPAALLIEDDPPEATPSDVPDAPRQPTEVALFVTEAGRPYRQADLDTLTGLTARGIRVVAVLTKIDLHPEWAEVQATNRAALATAEPGSPIPLLSVSTLHPETTISGIPQLLQFLDRRVIEQVDTDLGAAVLAEIRAVTDLLARAWTNELEAAASDRASLELAAGHQRALAELDRLTQASTGWQLGLGDGTTELMAQVEHDLRGRLRQIMRRTNAEILVSDPTRHWDKFETTLREQIAEAVTENFRQARQRARTLADQVATQLGGPGHAIPAPDIRLGCPEGLPDSLPALEQLETPRRAPAQQLVNSLRGSYGGILMVGVATSLIGLALINPWSIAAGVLLGAYTLVEDRRGRTERRKAEARIAVSTLIDDVSFEIGERSRTGLRAVHRTLRDHFTMINDQLLGQAHQSLQSAATAEEAHTGLQHARQSELRANLSDLHHLRGATFVVMSDHGSPTGGSGS